MEPLLGYDGGREIFKMLPPGQPMLFQFPLQQGRYKTTYVGMIAQESVILQLPLNPGITQLLAGAYAVVVRFVHDGQAYGFETRFLAAIRKPTPLLFLNYPNSVHQVKLRECDRLTILEKAVLTVGEEILEGVMTDIGCGGCRVKLPRNEKTLALVEGTQSVVQFGLFLDERMTLALRSTILHIDANGGKVKCRLSFSRDQDQELSRLAMFLQNLIKLLRE